MELDAFRYPGLHWQTLPFICCVYLRALTRLSSVGALLLIFISCVDNFHLEGWTLVAALTRQVTHLIA